MPQATAFFSAAEYYYFQRDFERSLTFYSRAASIWKELGETLNEAEISISHAYALMTMGQPYSGLDIARKAEATLEHLEADRELALVRIAIGHIYSVIDDKQRALESYTLAEKAFPDNIDLIERGRLYNGVGLIYEDHGDWKASLSYRRKALECFRKENYPFGEIATLPSLIKLSYLSGDLVAAEDYFQRTKDLSRELDDELYFAAALQQIGDYYFDHGLNERAAFEYYEALKTLQKYNAEYHIALVRNKLGAIFVRQRRYQEASEQYSLSLATSQRISSRFAEAQTLFNLAMLQKLNHDYDASLSSVMRAISVSEGLYANISSSKLRSSYVSNSFDRYELFIGLLMGHFKLHTNNDYMIRAFKAVEESRVRSILESITATSILPSLDAVPAIAIRENEIRILLDTKSNLLTDQLMSRGGASETEKLTNEIAELENELDLVRAELKQTSPVYSAIKDPPPFDVEDFQRNVLDEGSVLLEFFLGKEESYLWVVDKREVVAFVLPPRDEIEKRVEGLRSLLTARQPKSGESIDEREERVAAAEQEYWPAARELSNLLLGGPADKLRNKRLIVVPDGKLHYLPFSALPLPNSESDEPMLLTNEVVYQPSAQTLALLTQLGTKRSAVERRDLLIYSDPVFSADDERLSGLDVSPASADEAKLDTFRFVESLGSLPRLPGSKTETAAVIESSGTKAADSFSGFAANRDRLLNTDLSAYKVLHFATHGIVFDDRPELSGIVLSRFGEQGQQMNEFIRLQDIYGMKLNADLVVLSACDTGVGKEVKGEGIMSLNTAFLQSGARSVLASLWKVEDGAAQKLMKEFYSGISIENLTPSESLRRAQISLAKDPRYASPFYWAAFTLQGDPNVRPAIGRRSISLWALTAFPIWFAAAYFAWRRRVK